MTNAARTSGLPNPPTGDMRLFDLARWLIAILVVRFIIARASRLAAALEDELRAHPPIEHGFSAETRQAYAAHIIHICRELGVFPAKPTLTRAKTARVHPTVGAGFEPAPTTRMPVQRISTVATGPHHQPGCPPGASPVARPRPPVGRPPDPCYPPIRMPFILTLIAARDATTLSPATLARVRDAVGGGEPAILSPNEAADITLDHAPDPNAVRAALENAAIDAIATQADHRRKRLLIADMDSTIVTGETLDELADFAGLKQRIAAITARAMNGELDFKSALRERVAMLRGLPLDALEGTWQRVQLTPGARELVATMRAHGAFAVLVSGGFSFFTTRVAALCGFDRQHSNALLDDGRALTGEVAEPILDRDTKLAMLTQLAAERNLPLSATLAVGDGANDLDMIRAAGLGVAFHAKPIVSAAAARARVDHADLRALLFAQGYRAEEIVS